MPSFSSDGHLSAASATPNSSIDGLRKSNEKTLSSVFALTNGAGPEPFPHDHRPDQLKTFKTNSLYSLHNTHANGSTPSARERTHSKTSSTHSIASGTPRYAESGRRSPMPPDGPTKLADGDYLQGNQANGILKESGRPPEAGKSKANGVHPSSSGHDPHNLSVGNTTAESSANDRLDDTALLSAGSYLPPLNRFSSPPGMSSGQASSPSKPSASSPASAPAPPRLSHRHTLQIPKSSTNRNSREFSFSAGPSEEALSATGRFSPTTAENTRHRRASLGLVRRTTRSIQSDMHLDEVLPDEDAMRWTEAIRQKRASRRKRKEEEDDDRVIVGTKVDQGHVNWVTAYNMLTGIRFTVSRTNAKMDRELTEADFTARHKFSFDVTGNELTPSAKYDFKFKDYSPWVFRHLRAIFALDPADYLMSLTSKYILSELGSPGKSGSFFYFSRDYKYIIKTIHHAEHKLLRKILGQYYKHVLENPNTLISQFYGLHRVKIPYGRKIHFVVMNNLFPPHRDIHQMFDLKGSTIGRDFKEEDLEKNPRATLKDLNWLRRNLHLEFDPGIKSVFVEQMQRDVALLQRLKIMDYSLLVGIHDLEKGNEEKIREKELQVFQPGGERDRDDLGANMLMRTPSRLENARKARELRLTLKKEKPVPMGLVKAQMPDEIAEGRKDRIFYSDDGGIRATHEDGSAGEEVYYLGIIDCLTHYGIVKHAEHFWKSLSNPSSQISPIPPEGYGERFANFITGITMTKEEAGRERTTQDMEEIEIPRTSSSQPYRNTNSTSLDGGVRSQLSRDSTSDQDRISRSPAVDRTMEKAYKQADKSERHGAEEETIHAHTLGSTRSPSAERSGGVLGLTLPVVEEAAEAGSTAGGSGHTNSSGSARSQERAAGPETTLPPNTDSRPRSSNIRHVLPSQMDGAHDRSGEGLLPNIPHLPPLSASPELIASD